MVANYKNWFSERLNDELFVTSFQMGTKVKLIFQDVHQIV
jgi:hypothetical protein